ncbi:hypothetical protein LTR85_004160 [Meristemomyces frigidus]|nr:hypothetical protein LTR85_004160 [Meristemomyces frigidus]
MAEDTLKVSTAMEGHTNGNGGAHELRDRRPVNAQLSRALNEELAGLPASTSRSGLSTPAPPEDAPPSVKATSAARRELRRKQRMFPTVDYKARVSYFDPNSDYSNFRGFFVLFWVGLAIMVITAMLRNLNETGSILSFKQWPLFTQNIWELAASDLLMCASTGVSLPLHLLYKNSRGWLKWRKGGIVVQSVFQAVWLWLWITVPFAREWSWTAQVFLTLHTLAMFMKMHSYAFYNGHLSTTLDRLQKLDQPIEPTTPMDTAVRYPTTYASLSEFTSQIEEQSDTNAHEKLPPVLQLREDLAMELTSPIGNVTYAENLTISNFIDYLLCPTLCYELEYPRTPTRSYMELFYKTLAVFGCIFLLTITSEEFIIPVLDNSHIRLSQARGNWIDSALIFAETVSTLLFPFMITFLLVFLVIFEYVLGAFAEITRFADRQFYSDWWNSLDWLEFSREWNIPVHNFFRRHVYSASRGVQLSRPVATAITFFISAVAHELVMGCITRKFRGYGFVLMMMQIPFVAIQRMPGVRERRLLNNVMFWIFMIMGLSLLCAFPSLSTDLDPTPPWPSKIDCFATKKQSVKRGRHASDCSSQDAMNLVWTEQIEAPITKLVPQARSDKRGADDLRREQRTSRPLLFVTGRPKAKRKANGQGRRIPGTTAFRWNATSPEGLNDVAHCDTRSGILEEANESLAAGVEGLLDTSWIAPDAIGGDYQSQGLDVYEDTAVGDLNPQAHSFEPLEEIPEDLGDETDISVSMLPVHYQLPSLSAPSYLGRLSRGVQYNSAAHQAGAILEMYDREFCVLPLTMDVRHNPFRVRSDRCEGSPYLLHAVLAVSAQHLAKKHCNTSLLAEAQGHQALAVRHFREALDHTPAPRLLDTLLILVNFEATQTSSSAWRVHLSGARKLLEAMGTLQACQSNPKARAQIAMLAWWDVTLACISRRQMSLPISCIEALRDYDGDDGWTFFALNGCPIELVMHMAHLAKLASIYEQVIDLEHATFQPEAVTRIVDAVRLWKNPEDVTLEEVEANDLDVAARRHRYHCMEAWRNGIILYCYRVFNRPADPAQLRVITHLSRLVLDHVRCIPQTEVVQKQVLLPLFLAAAEAGDRATQDFARSYCAYWSETARYHMFATVSTLLEQIWTDWSASTRDAYWWGVKIEPSRISPEILVPEHLLG